MDLSLLRNARNPLYANAFWLMANSVVLNGFGFLFWTIVVRLYPVAEVGLATTVLSSLELILVLSLVGFNVALVRYLPKSGRKADVMSSASLISGLAALFFSLAFLAGLEIFSPKLMFLRRAWPFALLYAMSAIIYTQYTLIDSVFIAYRQAKQVTIKNLVFGGLKLALPFLLVAAGAFWIFMSVELAAAVSLAAAVLMAGRLTRLRPGIRIDLGLVRDMLRFCLSNYFANMLFYAPNIILPLMITSLIDPTTTAYFYFSVMVYGLLTIIPTAVAQSLLSEGSNSLKDIQTKVRRAFALSYLLLVPAAAATLVFGKYLMLLFGKAYSENTLGFLRLLAVSAVFSGANILFISIKNIQHRTRAVLAISIVISASILGISLALMPYGLTGIGLAWIAGQLAGNLVIIIDGITCRRQHGI